MYVLITPSGSDQASKDSAALPISLTTFHEHEMIRRIVIGTVDLKQELAVNF